MSIRLYFLIPKRGRKYSSTNSYIFAMALFLRKMIISQLELGLPVVKQD